MPIDPDSGPSPTSARSGHPQILTEAEIVDAALTLVRAEGLDALSAHGVSRVLGRSPMAPHGYVADEDALLALVCTRLLADVPLPEPESGPWQARLRVVIDGIDQLLCEHPGVAEILLGRLRRTDRRLLGGIAEILLSAGFVDADVVPSYAVIVNYLSGCEQVILHDDGFSRDVCYSRDTGGIEEPLARLVPLLFGLRGRDFVSYGIDTIIAGLGARLAAGNTDG